MTRIEVTKKIDFSIKLMSETLSQFSSEPFFTRKNDKWSPAEQAQHLVLSIKPLQLAYRLPGFALRLLFGKMNRPTRTYEDDIREKVENWKESDLDKYVLPHPLLGKISLREMLYFTDFHILHHNTLTKTIYLS